MLFEKRDKSLQALYAATTLDVTSLEELLASFAAGASGSKKSLRPL